MTAYQIEWNEPLPVSCQGGALTIGNFDGVHRGHQALLHELVRQARHVGGPAVVLTFDPHPVKLLRPDQCPPLLSTMDQRTRLLEQYGGEIILVMHSTLEMLNLRARRFFEVVIRDKIQPRVMVPGFNFAFGLNREGTVTALGEMCKAEGIEFVLVPPLQLDGGAVSSSRIRAAIRRGAVDEAAKLLGRWYGLTGKVAVGQRRGRTIGFPTANLEGVQTLVPANGVYAVEVRLDSQKFPGAANIGPNPTFGENAPKVEVHIIDFDGDLYGRELEVQFIQRLRDTVRFDSVDALVEQMRKDVAAARKIVADAQS